MSGRPQVIGSSTVRARPGERRSAPSTVAVMDDDAAPSLRLRRTAVAAGWSDDELGRMVRTGELARVRRGAYVAGAMPTDRAVAHALLVRATVAGLRRPAVVSHQSAAVLHGLPLWNTSLNRVHVTRRPSAWHDSGRVLHVHVARLGDDETTLVDGIPVTDAVRTALDLARSLPREAAVVALDAALHRELVSTDELESRLPGIVGTPGSRGAARAIAFADGRSESVGESRSRVILDRSGLAPSTLQHPVHRADGSLVGRADFAWEDERLVGEFDGRIKYGRLLRPGQTAGDAVFEEKRREDEIRDEGWRVVRWIWDDLALPPRLAGRVRRALERGR